MAFEDLQQKNPDAKIVSFPQLWAEIGGSCDFPLDNLIAQIARCEDDEREEWVDEEGEKVFRKIIGKDYYLNHRGTLYIVPKEKINEYFADHPKPIPPMSQKEELIYLRKKIKELEKEKAKLAKESKVVEEEKAEDEPEPEFETEEETPTEEPEIPKASEKEITTFPERDEGIPSKREVKKETPLETAKRLAEELKGKKGPSKETMKAAKPKDILKAPKEDEEAI